MKSVARAVRDLHQKEFVKQFDGMCGRQNRWTVWSDFVVMSAISISNAVDREHAGEREETYRTLSSKYNAAEMDGFAKLLAEVVMGMEANPDQDFLGELFMNLELSNDHAGQFFTPYSVCKCIAEMQGDQTRGIAEKGFVSVNDPACGAGALLIAFANVLHSKNINYQQTVLFAAQDIDYVVGCMCYIALSLMGCAGYVVIDDSIAHPSTCYDRRGLIPHDKGNVWYTPMYFSEIWYYRRIASRMDMLLQHTQNEPTETLQQPPKPIYTPDNKEMPLGKTPSVAPVMPVLAETKTGQLTFF